MKKLCLMVVAATVAATAFAGKPKKPKKPKNIVFMIGDGTALAHLFAAYASNSFALSIFDLAEYVGISITSSADDFITDSAAGATAFSIGQKTNNGMLAVLPDSTPIETIAETAAKAGLTTGAVVTCELLHATPAAFYAHQPSRKMYSQIAADMSNSNANVLIGGGFPFFDTSALRRNGFEISVGTQAMLTNHSNKQICFFNTDSFPLPVHKGRGDVLRTGSLHALHQLNKNKKGFFLMIEGSQIDWGAHDNDSNYVIQEVLDFDNTVKTVIDWARKDKNTLVIITADHECGGLTLTGYDSSQMRPAMHFSTGHHTAEPVPVFAFGPGAENFTGVYQNTEIYTKMMTALRLKKQTKKSN